MAKDVAPDLYNDIQKSFERRMEGDGTVQRIEARIKAGKATQADMSAYASKVGIHTGGAFKEVLTPGNLPDGKLYWNIAERTIAPRLEEDHALVLDRAKKTQEALNKKAGIGIKPPDTKLDPERVRGIMNMATAEGADLSAVFGDPVTTVARQMYDDFQYQNADNCDKLGVNQVVVREYDGVGLHDGKDTCEWCESRAGTWTMDDAKRNGVFERHPGCGCTTTVEYKNGYRSDAWSKAMWKGNDPEERTKAIALARREQLENMQRTAKGNRERELFIRDQMYKGATANSALKAWLNR